MIKYCPMCGTKFMENAKFCMNCGLSVVEYEKKLKQLKSGEQTTTSVNAPNMAQSSKPQPPVQKTQPKPQTQLSPEKLCELGITAEDKKDYRSALQNYVLSIKGGNTKAMFKLAEMYKIGKGIPKDEKKAFEWYEKAAKLGNNESMINLSNYYREGKIVKQNKTLGFEWAKKAADTGNLQAVKIIAECYLNGEGVFQDTDKAINCFKIVADNGEYQVMYRLGQIYESGSGIEKDLKKSLKWYKKALQTKDKDLMKKTRERIDALKRLLKEETINQQTTTKLIETLSSDMQSHIDEWYQKYGDLPQIYFKDKSNKCTTKINAAIKAYANGAENENVIFVFDETLFGGAEDGFLVTDKKIYIHNQAEKPESVFHIEILSMESRKISTHRELLINGEIIIKFTGYNQEKADRLFNLMNEINLVFGHQESENKITAPTSISSNTPSKSTLQSSTPMIIDQPKIKYQNIDTYVCDNPEAEKIYQLGKKATDAKEAMDLYLEAASKGHALAFYILAMIIISWNRGEESYSAIINNLILAAEGGLIEAMKKLGDCYYGGNFVERDLNKAAQWYEKVLPFSNDEDKRDINERLNLINGLNNSIGTFKNMVKNAVQNSYERIDKALNEMVEKLQLRCIYYNTANCSQKTKNKIDSAINAYVGQLQNGEYAIACFDSTTFGGAEDGCLFTTRGIYIHNPDEKMKYIDYKEINPDNLTERGLIMKDIYIGETKIDIAGCGYNEEERVIFCSIILYLAQIFRR